MRRRKENEERSGEENMKEVFRVDKENKKSDTNFMNAGLTLATCIPQGRSSRRSALVMPSTACFEARS